MWGGREVTMSYKIIRGFFRDDVKSYVIANDLTLEEAQAHCRDPETSSRTCTSKEGIERTEKFGPWFDRYESEEND